MPSADFGFFGFAERCTKIQPSLCSGKLTRIIFNFPILEAEKFAQTLTLNRITENRKLKLFNSPQNTKVFY